MMIHQNQKQKPPINSMQSIKIPMAFFISIENNPKICVEPQRPLIAKGILKKKNKPEGITLTDFKLYYKDIVFKTVWN